GVLIVTTLETRLIAGVDNELASRSLAANPPPTGGDGHRPPPPPHDEEKSPYDIKRYAFVSLNAQGRLEESIPSGPAEDPAPPPDVSGLQAPAGPITVDSVEPGGPHYRVVVTRQPDGGTLVTGISLADVDRAVRTTRNIVIVAGILAVFATGIIVWFTV